MMLLMRSAGTRPARALPLCAALVLAGCGTSSSDETSPIATGGSGGAAADGGGNTGGSNTGGSNTGGSNTGGSNTGGSNTGGSNTGGDGTGGAGSVAADECASPESQWVFCEDFESGTKDQWDDYDGNPDDTNLIMSEPGPSSSADNLVMRLRVAPGRGGADLVKVLPATYDRLYARWYVKYEAGFDFTAANHGGGLHAGARDWLGHSDTRPDGSDWFTAWIDYRTSDPHIFNIYSYYRGMYQDCVDPSGSCWGDNLPCTVDEGPTFCEKPQHRETVMPPTLAQDKWYCVELMADGGTAAPSEAGADGAFDFWVDGQEIGPWTDLWLRTTPDLKLSILWLSLFHHGEHSVEGVMYDNIVVSTDRVSCQ